MKHYFFTESERTIAHMKDIIISDGVIIAPTDTILGLMGKVNDQVFERLQTIKMRDGKPFVLLINSFDDLKNIATDISQDCFDFLLSIWPSPVTCIFNLNRDYAPWLFEKSASIALRMPDCKFLTEIIAQTGPLFSTSVNCSGKSAALDNNEIDPSIAKQVDYICPQKIATSYLPSTIIDCRPKEPVLIREGIVSFKDIMDVWNKKGKAF